MWSSTDTEWPEETLAQRFFGGVYRARRSVYSNLVARGQRPDQYSHGDLANQTPQEVMMRYKFRSPVFIVVAFLISVALARALSLYRPGFHVDPFPGFRIHHYVYGIFLLAISGYLALLFKGPRATTWISVLYGLGLGLTFDEFGFWVNVSVTRGVRWNTHGLLLIAFPLIAASLGPVVYKKVRNVPDARREAHPHP